MSGVLKNSTKDNLLVEDEKNSIPNKNNDLVAEETKENGFKKQSAIWGKPRLPICSIEDSPVTSSRLMHHKQNENSAVMCEFSEKITSPQMCWEKSKCAQNEDMPSTDRDKKTSESNNLPELFASLKLYTPKQVNLVKSDSQQNQSIGENLETIQLKLQFPLSNEFDQGFKRLSGITGKGKDSTELLTDELGCQGPSKKALLQTEYDSEDSFKTTSDSSIYESETFLRKLQLDQTSNPELRECTESENTELKTKPRSHVFSPVHIADSISDPFRTKSHIANSPAQVAADEDSVGNPFGTKSHVANSPAQVAADEDSVGNPFGTKSHVANSPAQVAADGDSVGDPFGTKSHVANSPAQLAADGDSVGDPFGTKSHVANSPAQLAADGDSVGDPFGTKSHVANSPAQLAADGDSVGDPFGTKSHVANSPAQLAADGDSVGDPFGTKSHVANSPAQVAADGDTLMSPFEIVYGAVGCEADSFVPATEVFNDPSVWDMFEKFDCSSDASYLTRQSLYVKFDPLVGAPNSPGKRCRPTKKNLLKQIKESPGDLISMNSPKSTVKNTPVTRKGRSQSSGMEDLICNFEPQSTNESAVCFTVPGIPLPVESNQAIIEVLKYSDSDFIKAKQGIELNFQNMMMQQQECVLKQLAAKDKEKEQIIESVSKLKSDKDELESIVKQQAQLLEHLWSNQAKLKEDSKTAEANLIKERDQALEDLTNVEKAFSDIHRRYEKMKDILQSFKQNEETLKTFAEKKITEIKEMRAAEKILKKSLADCRENSQAELKQVQKNMHKDVARLQALLKKKDLEIQSLEVGLEHKKKEIRELTAICDEALGTK